MNADGNAFGRICLSILFASCNFWHCWPSNFVMVLTYNFRISRSNSYVKVIWSRSRSQEYIYIYFSAFKVVYMPCAHQPLLLQASQIEEGDKVTSLRPLNSFTAHGLLVGVFIDCCIFSVFIPVKRVWLWHCDSKRLIVCNFCLTFLNAFVLMLGVCTLQNSYFILFSVQYAFLSLC